MKLRKLMFVLPNLFTVSSIFCGFYALTLCAGGARPQELYQAAIFILFAMVFDGFDGRVARLTKTQSQFGVELDSLADVVSFGIVPAMLVYKWALAPLGFVGTFISFVYASCGALRLARFNVIALRSTHGGSSPFFVGLPIPLAAGMIVSMVIANYGARGAPVSTAAQAPLAGVVLLLSLLMVSTVRYRTFKDLRLSRTSLIVFMAVCIGGVLVATQFHPSYVLVAYFSAYLLFGLAESGVILRRYLSARRVEARASAAGPALDDEEEEDEADAEEDVEEEDFL
jgi:CDP-diacylglycerol--serine O-phosphatidyltransferase